MRSKGKISTLRELARAVRARRKSLRVTQVELARLAGCGPVFVYALESAKPTLRLDKMLDVLEVLGLELMLVEGKTRLRVAPALAGKVIPRAAPKVR